MHWALAGVGAVRRAARAGEELMQRELLRAGAGVWRGSPRKESGVEGTPRQ